MSTTRLNAYSIARGAFVAAGVSLLGGCQSSAPEPQNMARTSLQTAPADLQLICANAVVAQASGARVLPTSSRQLDATTYAVDVDAGGRKFNCVVDSSGSVKSVQPA